MEQNPAWVAIMAKRPDWAQALIVAELEEDTSDLMSDYHGSRTVRTVAIGWRSGSREDFKQLRRAAATFPETAHLGPGCEHYTIRALEEPNGYRGHTLQEDGRTVVCSTEAEANAKAEEIRDRIKAECDAALAERGAWAASNAEANLLENGYSLDMQKIEHRDNYSMGHGNWLGVDQYSGWQVRSIGLKGTGYYDSRAIEDAIPEPGAPMTAAAVAGTGVSINAEKAGVEIRFPAKPDAAVLERLKAAGWRWSRFSQCWYAKHTPEAEAFARAMIGEAAAPVAGEAAAAPAPSGNGAAACRRAADALEKRIHEKLHPAIGDQRPTARRARIADNMRREGETLAQVQRTLRTLADLHEAGTIPAPLARLTSCAAIERARWGKDTAVWAALQPIWEGTEREPSAADKIRELERELLGYKIPGFFPTPRPVAERLLELAEIEPGMMVLEPSAGAGAIADLIREQQPDANLLCIEYQHKLQEILRLKGHAVVGSDFTTFDPARDAELRKDLGVSREALDAYEPENAVRKLGPKWLYATVAGTDAPAVYGSKQEALKAATAHKELKRQQFEDPTAYRDIVSVRARKALDLIKKYEARGMSEMEAGAKARLEIPDYAPSGQYDRIVSITSSATTSRTTSKSGPATRR